MAEIDNWLAAEGFRWVQRLGTPDGEFDWILRPDGGGHGVCRLYCPDPAHPVSRHELQGLLQLRASHPEWLCIAVIIGPLDPEARRIAETAGIQVHQWAAEFFARGD